MGKPGDRPIGGNGGRNAPGRTEFNGVAVGSLPEPTNTTAAVVVSASHTILFEDAGAAECDACGARLSLAVESDGYDLPGQGAYVWVRGDAVHLDRAPLCADCASAIGVAALARWEIEEEEG